MLRHQTGRIRRFDMLIEGAIRMHQRYRPEVAPAHATGLDHTDFLRQPGLLEFRQDRLAGCQTAGAATPAAGANQ